MLYGNKIQGYVLLFSQGLFAFCLTRPVAGKAKGPSQGVRGGGCSCYEAGAFANYTQLPGRTSAFLIAEVRPSERNYSKTSV